MVENCNAAEEYFSSKMVTSRNYLCHFFMEKERENESTYQYKIVAISSEKSCGADPFILHSLVRGAPVHMKYCRIYLANGSAWT